MFSLSIASARFSSVFCSHFMMLWSPKSLSCWLLLWLTFLKGASSNVDETGTVKFEPPEQSAIYLCTVVRNEDLYIDEWIEYHLAIGFDQIHVFDNFDYTMNRTHSEVMSTLHSRYPGQVILHRFPGARKKALLTGYKKFVTMFHTQDVYGAFLSVDEYLVLKKHRCVREFLKQIAFPARKSLYINTITFGNNGHDKFVNLPVLGRFTKRHSEADSYLRSFAYIPHVKHINAYHTMDLQAGKIQFDALGIPFVGLTNENKKSISMAVVHHYATRSREEFVRKIASFDEENKATAEKFYQQFNAGSIVFDDSALQLLKSVSQNRCGNLVH